MHTTVLPALSITLLVVFLAACAGPGRDPGPERAHQGPYTGPGVRIDSDGPRHLIIVTATSGGWSLSWDRTDEPARSGEPASVYLTLTRPDPSMMHTQALVDHRIDSKVPAQSPVRVYVRVIDHGAAPDSAAYALAASG
jgi:hypothetical protein